MLKRVAVVFCFGSLSLLAQSVGSQEFRTPSAVAAEKRRPASFSRPAQAVRPHRLGRLRQEEIDAVLPNPFLSLRGVERSVPPEAMNAGSWASLDDGGALWRMSIESTGAGGLRFHFTNFDAGTGEVWIYSPDGSQVFGPYSSFGPDESGAFWSDTVYAEQVVVEYRPNGPAVGAVPFLIDSVLHVYPQADPMAAGTCELDVTCNTTWATQSSGVGLMTFQSGGGSYACSGALINNTKKDNTPYFLTANHCIGDAATAKTVEVYWNYQTTTCNGTPPSLSAVPHSLGATWLASQPIPSGDFSLIQLSALPAGVNLTFYGWNSATTALNIGDATVAIHHPMADFTRISTGVRDPDQTVSVGTDLAPGNFYYQIRNLTGRIEPGSSGSPLFGPDKNIVGTLTYGPGGNACSITPFSGGYGRFSVAYPSYAKWLSPTASGTSTPPPAATPKYASTPVALTYTWQIGTAAPAAQSVKVSPTTTVTTSSTLTVKASAAWIAWSPASLTVTPAGQAALAISIVPTSLANTGTQTGTLTLSNADATVAATIAISVTVQAPPAAVGPATVIPMWSDGAGTATTLSISNPYATQTIARVSFQLANGTSVNAPLASGSSTTVTIPAHGTGYVVTAGTSSPQVTGPVVIAATEAAKKLPVQAVINNDSITAAVAGAFPLFVPFDGTAAASTTLTIFNPGTTSLTFNLSIYDNAGTLAGTGLLIVPPNQQGLVPMTRTAAVFGGRRGTLQVAGNGPALVQGIRTASDGRISTVLPVAAP